MEKLYNLGTRPNILSDTLKVFLKEFFPKVVLKKSTDDKKA